MAAMSGGMERKPSPHRGYELLVGCILLAAAVAIPRLCARALLVKYDWLIWDTCGGGYSNTFVALGAKLLCGALVLASPLMMLQRRTRSPVWLALMAIAAVNFATISAPAERDIDVAIERGSRVIARLDAFERENGRYPESLAQLGDVPHTGLARERRFFYAAAGSPKEDKGSWFPSTRAFLGEAPYVICVPLVPGGTLLYRPDGDYSDLEGRARAGGWFHTGRD